MKQKKTITIPKPVQGKVAKVPVVMQMEALECGAACLNMILAYYKKFVTLEKSRTDCGVSRDGSSAGNIMKAAKNYGLQTKALLIDRKGVQKKGKFPCIVHWNHNHFVVLDGFTKKYAVLNDPAKGLVKVSLEEFDKAYTGIYLEFEPGETFEPGGKRKSMLDFSKERLKGTQTAIIFVIVTTVILSLFGIIEPAFKRIFLDKLLTGESPDWLMPFIVAMVVLVIAEFIASAINSIYNYKIEGKLAIIANSKYMWHVLRLPLQFFSQRMAGDIADRQAKNESVAKELIQTLAPVFLHGMLAVVYFTVMLSYSVPLACIALAATGINLAVATVISKKRINITRVQMRDAGKLAGIGVTGIEMIETIKASGAESGFFNRWAGTQASVNTQEVNYAHLNHFLGAVPEAVNTLANIVVLAIGVAFVIHGQFTVGMVTAFTSVMGQFSSPVKSLIEAGQKIQEMRTNMERIEDVLNYETDVKENAFEMNADDNISYEKLSGAVEIKNVSFGYSPLADPLIKNFSMSIKPGSRVAFVGSSGCGKSTIAKLISGLYKPWEGSIEFDGKPLQDISRAVFMGSLAVVDQDIILFEDTIANNIKMWDSSIEDFEMILAARDAHIHDDIIARNGGYEYKLTEGGKDFSGGQRQRLEIARVLAQDPTIIIMDEATSALDAKTEYDVVNAIRDRGITCIVVAHRLSTIKDCDEIVVMDNGKVVQRGTHEELYAQNGLYNQLITNE
ncbi:MAG: NHLP family bacteriocin export ABC transporter peptidase/permease/ATPase subunit [Ruminococcaceae bacterium]|nr:NHLP family bacteriocin export ABC transporter peptidase/permease/ATPase subunit [Oscillospiraceae bacterium]